MERIFPYTNNNHYLSDMLRLVALRLQAFETAQAADGAVEGYKTADAFEATIDRRFRRTLDEDRVVGLEYLFETFSLTRFERHCIRMALAVELDETFAAECARLQKNSYRLPTIGFCIRTYCAGVDERRALAARRWNTLADFFCLSLKGPFLCSDLDLQLKIDNRILVFAGDMEAEDAELGGLVDIHWPWVEPEPLVIRWELPDCLERHFGDGSRPQLFYLYGEDGAGRRLCIRHFCRGQQLPLLVADMRRVTGTAEEAEQLLRKIFRESRLRQGAVCLCHFEAAIESESLLAAFFRAMRFAGGVLFLTGTEKWQPEMDLAGYALISLEVQSPDTSERICLWRAMLQKIPVDDRVDVEEIAAKFAFTGGQIRGAVDKAALLARGAASPRVTSALLHRACREQVSHKLGERATPIPVRYGWDDLILPPLAKTMLRNACDQVRFNHQVYGEWGFGEKIAYGRGISMLFSGPPGTGKTMAAQVIAGELQLEAYKVDLSGVVSKYIGETEKNLNDVFREVKKSQSILFFDEADALFGKRSETKDAHDKYANMETAFLLQKMEEYEGVVILASNFLQNFDDAFKRRLKFIIEFPFPDTAHRLEMWRKVFPEKTPMDTGIDYPYLAENFQLSGSSIKNVAVSAAFLAARENDPVTMEHIMQAVVAEMRKFGKNLLKEDLKEYYYILDGIR